MNGSPQVVIALSADWAYSAPVMTLIKSVCYHQKNVRFYLLNKDYPIEWTQSLNKILQPINCEVLDAKVQYQGFKNFSTRKHITETTYYRFVMPDLPEDKILYLDSDIVVETPLLPLFSLDLGDKMLAAAPDMLLNKMEHKYDEFPDMKPYFNAGVLLVNNKAWREKQVQPNLFNLASRYEFPYSDQDIMNIYFKNQWIELNPIYNFQTGSVIGLYEFKFNEDGLKVEQTAPQAQIIHYTTHRKPWLMLEKNIPPFAYLLRERYWHYHQMQWSDIIQRHLNQDVQALQSLQAQFAPNIAPPLLNPNP